MCACAQSSFAVSATCMPPLRSYSRNIEICLKVLGVHNNFHITGDVKLCEHENGTVPTRPLSDLATEMKAATFALKRNLQVCAQFFKKEVVRVDSLNRIMSISTKPNEQEEHTDLINSFP